MASHTENRDTIRRAVARLIRKGEPTQLEHVREELGRIRQEAVEDGASLEYELADDAIRATTGAEVGAWIQEARTAAADGLARFRAGLVGGGR